MSQATQNIADLIRELAKSDAEIYSLPCKVTAVNGDFADLEPLNGDPELFDVKLVAGQTSTPLYIEPAVDSVVIATFLSKDTAFISLYSEIESIQLRGDQYGGLVKIEDLVTKLNNVEDKVNSILQTLQTTTIPLAPSGTYPLATNFGTITPLVSTQQTELENTEVKHG